MNNPKKCDVRPILLIYLMSHPDINKDFAEKLTKAIYETPKPKRSVNLV